MKDETELERCRIGIVGRLREVHMVIGVAILVFALIVAHYLQCTVGNHFVYVHVGRCSCTALDKVNRELVNKCTLHNLFTSLLDCRADFLVKSA